MRNMKKRTWLAEFQDKEGNRIYYKIQKANRSRALITACGYMDTLENIDENVVPKVRLFKPEDHDALITPVIKSEVVEEQLSIDIKESKDTIFDFGSDEKTEKSNDDSPPDSLNNHPFNTVDPLQFIDQFDTPYTINDCLAQYDTVETLYTQLQEIKNDTAVIDSDNASDKVAQAPEKNEPLKKPKTEKPTKQAVKKEKVKKEPVNYLILPKSKEYPLFPHHDVPKEPTPVIDHKFLKAVADINHQIDRLFHGEVLRLEGIPDAVYHATKGIGSTKLKKFADAPAKYKANVQLKSKSLDMGHAVHTRILQPEIFDTTVACKPPWLSRNSNEYKDIAAHNPNVSILNKCDYDNAKLCSNELMHRYGQFFTGGVSEVSYWKKDEKTGLILKARIDHEHDGLCVDLKTTVSAAPGDFERNACKYGYHIQDALYSIVTGIEDFVFIAIETSNPFLSTFNVFNEVDRALSKEYCNELLHSLSLCQKKNVWPGYTEADEITQMDLNYFTRQKIENFYS